MTKSTFIPAVLVREDRDAGAVPMLLRRRGPFGTLGCVPFPYCGPLVAPRDLAACLDLLGRRRGVIRSTLQFPPRAVVDQKVLIDRGFDVCQDVTYVIDTSAHLDVLWSGLTSECRRRVRLTRKNGVELTEQIPVGALESFEHQVFNERGARSGYDGGLSPHLRLLSGPDLRSHTVAAVRDGEVLGVLVTLAHGTEALGWMGGVFPQP